MKKSVWFNFFYLFLDEKGILSDYLSELSANGLTPERSESTEDIADEILAGAFPWSESFRGLDFWAEVDVEWRQKCEEIAPNPMRML
jgi:hypothetical protein